MLQAMPMRRLILAALALAALATPVLAAEKMYSYVPADDATKARTDQGLTFVFDKNLLTMRMKIVLATEAHAEADLEPVDERDLGAKLDTLLPEGANERLVYAVKAMNQGPAMVKAFCPGSSKGWLVFSPLRPRQGTTVQALGEDPVTGKARYCATLKFDFRGEWRMPPAANRGQVDIGPPPLPTY
jgi:hypothetical protein